MKLFIAIAFMFAVVAAADDEVCHDSVVQACSRGTDVNCSSLFGGIKHVEPDMQSYANSQLATSYDYMLLSAHFNTYQKNRPGFNKLISGLSDKAWDDAVALIKQITKRGGIVNFNQRHPTPSTLRSKEKIFEVEELNALSMILDSEKKLGNDAFLIHRRVSHIDHNSEFDRYDPEITHFLEEKFVKPRTSTIRTLSGYTNDLKKLMAKGNSDTSLNVYLFDQYLEKQ